jgi:hypothetical protein
MTEDRNQILGGKGASSSPKKTQSSIDSHSKNFDNEVKTGGVASENSKPTPMSKSGITSKKAIKSSNVDELF